MTQKIFAEHMEVLKTMCDTGLIDRQAMKTIRGQIKRMSPDEAEVFLRKVIKNRSGKARSMVYEEGEALPKVAES